MADLIKRWKEWLGSQTIQRKMIWIYIIFGSIPMFVMAVYTYHITETNLLDQAKRDVEKELEWTAYGIEDRFDRLDTVIKQLSMDREWKECLKEYRVEHDISRLYEFTDELFCEYKSLYPDINSLSLYGVEEKMSSGTCCFYPLKAGEEPLWYEEIMKAGGAAVFFCEQEENGFNLMYLKALNAQGVEDTPLIIKMEMGPCGWICAIVDKAYIGRNAGKNAAVILFFYLGIVGVAFVCTEYSVDRLLKQRLERVKVGMEIIGKGDLSYRIPSAGSDEIGKVADYLNDMTSQLEHNIEESYKKELLVKEAELDLMQEQINPHFLYNALSMISAIDVKAGNDEGAEMSRCLSEFYRISLNKGKKLLTVREEIVLTESYLKIQNARFGGIVSMECSAAPDVLELYTLKLLLQPVIENAISHGRENEMDHIKLEISVYRSRERVVFEILDDGKGMKPEQLYEVSDSIVKGGRGYGLHNVNTRIRNYYGGDYGIYLESEYGFGTKTTIEIPIVEVENIK